MSGNKYRLGTTLHRHRCLLSMRKINLISLLCCLIRLHFFFVTLPSSLFLFLTSISNTLCHTPLIQLFSSLKQIVITLKEIYNFCQFLCNIGEIEKKETRKRRRKKEEGNVVVSHSLLDTNKQTKNNSLRNLLSTNPFALKNHLPDWPWPSSALVLLILAKNTELLTGICRSTRISWISCPRTHVNSPYRQVCFSFVHPRHKGNNGINGGEKSVAAAKNVSFPSY